MDSLSVLINRGRELPVKLSRLPQLESKQAAAYLWLEQTKKAFHTKKSLLTLIEVTANPCTYLVPFSGTNIGCVMQFHVQIRVG
jgi:hypothetical protein